MLLSYIKIALRNLRRNRLIAFINIFGLGLSMSIGLMELVIIQDNLSYDTFHPYPKRTFRIISDYRQKDGQRWKFASTPFPLSDALRRDTANIVETVNVYPGLNGPATSAGKEINLNAAFTGASFFHVFGFTLANGDPQTALSQPNGIILSPATAQKFFGAANPMGKIISFGKKGQYLVTGVLAPNGKKSHLGFDAYASSLAVPGLVTAGLLPDLSDNWQECHAYTYVLTKNEKPFLSLKGQLGSIAAAANIRDKKGTLSFAVQTLSDITPSPSDLYNDIGRGTSWDKLWTGILITLLLLIAACFNYTNLTVARALTRAKEVGVRKINGARRYQIFLQYITEACVTTFLSLAFAWLLFSLIIRYAPFNDGYEIVPSSFRYNGSFFAATLGFTLFTSLLAGIAPAWILSAFRPLRVLKNLTTAKLFGSVGLQKTLIVFQYSLSLVVILFLSAFYRQFSFMASADHGFRRDNVLVVPLNGADKERTAAALSAVSGVRSVSGLSINFTPRFEGARGTAYIDNNQKWSIHLNYIFTDRSFIPAMNIHLLAGTN
ncbi:MAG TPA: ABC transporter permease, partial [Puia sp.]